MSDLAIVDVVAHYLGLPPGTPLDALVVTNIDQFFVTVDLRHFLRALGGPYQKLVERVENETKTRAANTKAYLAGAGAELGKENP